MMSQRFLSLSFALLFLQWVSALQVTPNSPCSSACMDNSNADASDPSSSNTRNSDMACEDNNFSGAAAVKWKQCMTCLQNSTFHQGSESDQSWFLYNLRYQFDYCVFGFPNATGIGSNPCQTSTACGPLEKALQDGNLSPKGLSEFAYCDADGGAMTGPSYSKCLACISATGDTNYVANGLVALEAGCQQRPAAGKVVGLSDTIFATTVVTIVDPSTIGNGSAGGSSSSGLSTPLIAAIITGVLVVLAVAAAFLYIRHRKRTARCRHTRSDAPAQLKLRHHRPKSSLSFRCQTHLSSPRSPSFPFSDDPMESTPGTPAVSRHITSSKSVPWRPTSFQSVSTVLHGASAATKTPLTRLDTTVAPSEKSNSASYWGREKMTPQSTTTPTAMPRAAAVRRDSASPAVSNINPFDTPTSSTNSIPPASALAYNPADFGINTAAVEPPAPVASPTSARSISPLLRQQAWGSLAGTPRLMPSPASSARPAPLTSNPPITINTARTPHKEKSSPIETGLIQTVFAAPPTRPKR